MIVTRPTRVLIGSTLLGLSLATKHELLFLPIWLAIGQHENSVRGNLERVAWLLIPYAVFAAAILPWPGLWNRIVHYQSTNNMPLWYMLNVGNILGYTSATNLMIGTLVLAGLCYRRRSPVEQWALYCIVLVAFSSACANHYLTIPIAALAMDWKRT